MDALCDERGRCPWPSKLPLLLVVARECDVLTLLALRADALDARREKSRKFMTKLWGLPLLLNGEASRRGASRTLNTKLCGLSLPALCGEASAAYGCRGRDEIDRGEPCTEVGRGGTGSAPSGGVSRCGSVPCLDQRFDTIEPFAFPLAWPFEWPASDDVRRSFDAYDAYEDSDENDVRGFPSP